MSDEILEQATREVVSIIPNRADDMARLGVLLGDSEPIVTVIGKYNHGKSRLLNELIGHETFAVADRRETVKLSASVHHAVRWLDAPGLDADVGTEDDRHALHAAWLKSDIRLFVHAAKEGELDAKELALLGELHADSERTQRQTILVLTQVDQLPNDIDVHHVLNAISTQVPSVAINAVSSTRHRKGLEEGKKLLLERSGMPLLRLELDAALVRVPKARTHEIAILFDEISGELEQLLVEQENLLATLRQTQRQQRQKFGQGLKTVIDKVSGDIEAMLDALGADNASVPDSAKEAYAVTAGKRERAHIQIAYSRACIEIDSFLAGHGALALPSEQETVARALNSVMVVVMGVSVKFRSDLRRIFCTEPGRERMGREFSHYYELSADRKALAAHISESESVVAGLNGASASLHSLEVVL